MAKKKNTNTNKSRFRCRSGRREVFGYQVPLRRYRSLCLRAGGHCADVYKRQIDSPVAAYRMAKRGLALDHIHFASPPYTSERAKLKVKALAQLTSIYTGSSNLFVVPYTKPQEYICLLYTSRCV